MIHDLRIDFLSVTNTGNSKGEYSGQRGFHGKPQEAGAAGSSCDLRRYDQV